MKIKTDAAALLIRSLIEKRFKKTFTTPHHGFSLSELKLLEERESSVIWVLPANIGKGLFVKAELIPDEHFWEFIGRRQNAHEKNRMHDPKAVSFTGFVIVPVFRGPNIVRYREPDNLPSLEDRLALYVECQRVIVGTSYAQILEGNVGKKTIDEEDTKRVWQIAKLIGGVHLNKPDNDATVLYNESLQSLLRDCIDYIPLFGDHPILTAREVVMAQDVGRDKAKEFANRGNFACALHGDLWRRNIVFSDEDGLPYLVDFHYRHNWGPAGFDIGRFLMDFIRLYLLSNNIYFLDLADLFLDAYVDETRNADIRSYLWTGIFSRMWIAINPPNKSGYDTVYARKVFDVSMQIIVSKRYVRPYPDLP